MHVCVVSYHYTDDGTDRPVHVVRALAELPFVRGLTVFASDYDHIRKQPAGYSAHVIRVPVRPYQRNISWQRVLSYRDFAQQVNGAVAQQAADVVYVCVPDYLSAFAILRDKRPGQRVVVDVVDLWPDALPLPFFVNGVVKKLLGPIIREWRRRLFRRADAVLFQSQYFLEKFGGSGPRYRLLPMCLAEKAPPSATHREHALSAAIKIFFLGSMNSITDIDSLVRIVRSLAAKRAVTLTVIGGGIGETRLRKQLRHSAVRLNLRGVTFDPTVKETEMSQAHFGFNGYKRSTEVAVSYKALEYLRHGVPLINGTKGDLTNVVEKFGCGFNYSAETPEAASDAILALSEAAHLQMADNARRAFQANYSYSHFKEVLEDCMKTLYATPQAKRVSRNGFSGR